MWKGRGDEKEAHDGFCQWLSNFPLGLANLQWLGIFAQKPPHTHMIQNRS